MNRWFRRFLEMREVITVYGIEKDGSRFKIAGYSKETALKVVNDYTIKCIVKAEKLIAVNSKGVIIAESNEV